MIIHNIRLRHSILVIQEGSQVISLLPLSYYNKYGVFDVSLEFHQEQIGNKNMIVNDIQEYIQNFLNIEKT